MDSISASLFGLAMLLVREGGNQPQNPQNTTIMPRKSTRAEQLQQQKITEEIQRAYSSTVSGNLFHQNGLEEEDESDGLGVFDEDMEIFAPEETEDVGASPW